MSTTPLILIVDADLSTHDLARAALGGDHEVLSAASATRGLDIARERPPMLLVADEKTAGSLAGLVDRVKAASPRLWVVALTDASRSPDEVRALASLGPVLVKPLDGDKLGAAVRSLIRLDAIARSIEDAATDDDGDRASDLRRKMATTRRDLRSKP